MAHRWKVLIVTAAAVFMSFLDVTIVNIAFPEIRADFAEDSLATLSWVLNGYNVVFAALLVPAGRIADLVGRRKVFLWSLAGFAVASALCAAAPSAEALIAGRVLQAVAGAALVPTALALLLPEFPLEQRATATAIYTASGAVAAATGPSLGGVLVDVAGWRWVFLVNLPVAAVVLVAARRLLRESRDPGATRLPDLAGSALLALGIGALALGLVKSDGWGWGSAGVLGSFAVAGVALAAFVARSTRHPAPVVELSLFRVRSFAVANASMLLYSAAFYALLLANVLFLTQVWGYSVLEAGFAVTPGPLMAAVAAGPAGALCDRFGQRVIAVPGVLVFAAGVALLALRIGPEPAYASEVLPAMFVTGIGVGMTFASLGSAAVAELPPARFATGSAINGCVRQVGAVLGIATLVAVIGSADPADPVGRFSDAYWAMAVAAAAAGVIAVGLGRVRARNPDAARSPVAA
jgi:EmrB/QacA subfamily drug resistance transporter